MAALVFSRSCRLCRISCISMQALCDHVMGERHRMNLQQSSPEQVKEIGRVQYFLDTHLGEEPLLGLEYIVEEQRCFSYSYSCRLCNVEQCNWLEAVHHILDADHTTGYIDQHHRELSLSGKKYPSQADYMRDLRLAALTIYKKCGNNKIQVNKPALTSIPAKVANASSEDVCEEIGALPSQGKAIDVVVSQPKVTPAKPLPRKRALRETDAKEKGSTSDSSMECRTGPYSCTLCNVCHFTVTDLCKHIMSFKHRKKLHHYAAMQHHLEKDKLQYILDTYVKEEPILGLEYIFEENTDSLYSYTCQLCNEKNNLYCTFRHLMSNNHMTLYIQNHHKELLNGDGIPVDSSSGYITTKRLRRIAIEVQESYGRKKIDEKPGIGTLTSKGKDVQEVELTWTDDTLSDFNVIRGYICHHCNLSLGSYKCLCQHLMKKKHRMNLLSTTPQWLKELGRLKYLLEMHLKDYPVLGLEYVVEMQVSCVYVYTCQLCSVKGDWCHMPVHLMGVGHLERYIDKHHSKLAIKPEMIPQKEDYARDLRANAYKICKTFGRKEIQVVKDVNIPAQVTKQPLQTNSRISYTASSKCPEDEMSPIQELQFRRNEEFLDYLNNFVIKDKEDALFMQKIALNCANALVSFGEEQLPEEKLVNAATGYFF